MALKDTQLSQLAVLQPAKGLQLTVDSQNQTRLHAAFNHRRVRDDLAADNIRYPFLQ